MWGSAEEESGSERLCRKILESSGSLGEVATEEWGIMRGQSLGGLGSREENPRRGRLSGS